MKISAFCLTTNAIKFQYPFIESIKSWLPVVDELVVIDGGSTDGTIEKIKEIGNSKIRIVSDEDTKWEDDWEYSRMGKNFNRGYKECTGDIVIKFDIDYVLHEDAYQSMNSDLNFNKICQKAMTNNNLIIGFTRRNCGLVDRYFVKTPKTLAINRVAVKRRNVPVVYGWDFARWGFGYEPIVPEYKENDVSFGTMLKVSGNVLYCNVKVFNYGFAFCDNAAVKWVRQRHEYAEVRQKMKAYKSVKISPHVSLEELDKNPDYGINHVVKETMHYLKNVKQNSIKIEEHSIVIREKIKSMKPEQFGYNVFGNSETAKYFL